jgi:hypothetical protein
MTRRVHPSVLPESPLLKFSFKHLDPDHPKFRIDECPKEFWCALHRSIKHYSTWTVEQFRDENNNLEKRHPIYFQETSEPNGFGIDEEQLDYEEAWQFSVIPVPTCIWRVHGILQEDTFYVVWLDRCHRLFRKPYSC